MQINEKIPVKSEKTAHRIIDHEAVIVLLDKQQTIVLNEVGARIWEIIDGVKSINTLAQIISCEFEITFAEALKDTNDFIEDLAQREIILIK